MQRVDNQSDGCLAHVVWSALDSNRSQYLALSLLLLFLFLQEEAARTRCDGIVKDTTWPPLPQSSVNSDLWHMFSAPLPVVRTFSQPMDALYSLIDAIDIIGLINRN